jgi:hypothetical protein
MKTSTQPEPRQLAGSWHRTSGSWHRLRQTAGGSWLLQGTDRDKGRLLWLLSRRPRCCALRLRLRCCCCSLLAARCSLLLAPSTQHPSASGAVYAGLGPGVLWVHPHAAPCGPCQPHANPIPPHANPMLTPCQPHANPMRPHANPMLTPC